MFTVSSVDLPTDTLGYSPILAVINNPIIGVILAKFQLNETSDLNQSTTVAVPTFTGDSFTVSVPAGSQPQQVTIGKTTYDLTDDETPVSGQFTHNPLTNEITIYV